MNNLTLPSLAAGMAAALSMPCAVAESVITLKSGESLPAEVNNLRDQSLTVQSPLLADPMELQMASLNQLSTPAPLSIPDQSSVITLHNGDTLYGTLTALEDKTIRLTTAWGTQLNINRDYVKHIGFESQKAYLRNATESLQGWTAGNGMMPECRDGYWIMRMTNQMSMSTEKQLPEQVHVQCTLYHTTSFNFTISLWENSQSGPNKVELSLATDKTELSKVNSGRHQKLGRIAREAPQNWYSDKNIKRSNIDFYADWKKGNYYLYLNGEPLATWDNRDNDSIFVEEEADEEEAKAKPGEQKAPPFKPGNKLSIQGRDDNNMALARFNVLAWNGAPPAPQALADPVSKYDSTAPKDKVFLLNGDVLRGAITLIEGGSIRVKSDHYDTILPTTKIRSLEQSRQTEQKLPEDESNIRVFLTDQSVLSMTMDSIGNDTLQGHSPSAGSISIPLSALRTIQFNLRDPELQKQRETPFVTK